MVLGSGLIAKGFEEFIHDNDILIFASGVSNSKETNDLNFKREFNLLKSAIYENPEKKLVYFSTCSIYDASVSFSPYVNHKLAMEKFISFNSKRYLIFRLPNVIGYNSNPNTFFNFFRSKITTREVIYIQKHATRYLIDVRDLTQFLPLFIKEKSFENKIVNACIGNQMPVAQIIELFECILKIKANKKIILGGTTYNIDCHDFVNFLNMKGINFVNDYNFQILEYYLSN